MTHQFKVTSRHRSTVLAALRYWQTIPPGTNSDIVTDYPNFGDIATNGGTEEPLSDDEIDELCEAINVAELISIDIGAPAKRLLLLYEIRDAARYALEQGLGDDEGYFDSLGKPGTDRLRAAVTASGVQLNYQGRDHVDRSPVVRLVYPEERTVRGSVVIGWAKDRFLDGDIENEPKTLPDAIAALEDLGLITVRK